jgi:hypothetical protein
MGWTKTSQLKLCNNYCAALVVWVLALLCYKQMLHVTIPPLLLCSECGATQMTAVGSQVWGETAMFHPVTMGSRTHLLLSSTWETLVQLPFNLSCGFQSTIVVPAFNTACSSLTSLSQSYEPKIWTGQGSLHDINWSSNACQHKCFLQLLN